MSLESFAHVILDPPRLPSVLLTDPPIPQHTRRLIVDPDLLQPNDVLSGQVRHWIEPGIIFDPAELDKDGQVVGKHKEQAVTEYIPCMPGPPEQ